MTLLTLIRSTVPEEAMEEVQSYARQVLAIDVRTRDANGSAETGLLPGALGRKVAQTQRFNAAREQMRRTYEVLTQENAYDVVFFHGKSVFPVIENEQTLPIVADFCDATSMRYRARMRHASMGKLPVLALRYLQVRTTEKRLVRKSSRLCFISRRDREAILGPYDTSEIVTNGIDLAYWQRGSRDPNRNCIVFTGVMSYSPNEDAALYLIDEILPLLRDKHPDLQIVIAGREPTSRLVERAERSPQVTVTGFVEDLRPFLEEASIFVCPLRYASGQQNKILEAMAMELPVVATSISADGLEVEEGHDVPIVVADGAQAFADGVSRLLEDRTEQRRLALESRRYVEENFNWSQSARKLERMCREALEGTS